MKDCGKILRVDEKNITVEIGPQAECHKCGACHGAKKQQLTIPIKPAYEDIKIGDSVELLIDDSIMLKVYVLLYGVPLLVFIACILLVYYITAHPLISFTVAIVSTAIAYLFLGMYTRSRSAFLKWDLMNLILLCRDCHCGVHHDPAGAAHWLMTHFPHLYEYQWEAVECPKRGRKLPRRNCLKSWKAAELDAMIANYQQQLREWNALEKLCEM